jgi:predicted alpha/beta superfamily hydrolase
METVFNFKFLILILGFELALNSAIAQETKIINDSIFSKVLNEQRKIKTYLPEEYKPGSDTKYDVVYLLDGEMHFDDFSFIYKFASNEKLIPSLILVALPNTYLNEVNMRDRDFLPEKTPENNKAGGVDNFIAFFKNELIPFIDKKLLTSGDNSLFGHSLGGVFTMYVQLKKPDLFTNYYCSDPGFPWNNRRIITMAMETANKRSYAIGV